LMLFMEISLGLVELSCCWRADIAAFALNLYGGTENCCHRRNELSNSFSEWTEDGHTSQTNHSCNQRILDHVLPGFVTKKLLGDVDDVCHFCLQAIALHVPGLVRCLSFADTSLQAPDQAFTLEWVADSLRLFAYIASGELKRPLIHINRNMPLKGHTFAAFPWKA
jgi:hypothetical protein